MLTFLDFGQLHTAYFSPLKQKELMGTAYIIGYELQTDRITKHGETAAYSYDIPGVPSAPLSHQQMLFKTPWISVYRGYHKELEKLCNNFGIISELLPSEEVSVKMARCMPSNIVYGKKQSLKHAYPLDVDKPALQGWNLALYLLKYVLYTTSKYTSRVSPEDTRLLYIGNSKSCLLWTYPSDSITYGIEGAIFAALFVLAIFPYSDAVLYTPAKFYTNKNLPMLLDHIVRRFFSKHDHISDGASEYATRGVMLTKDSDFS